MQTKMQIEKTGTTRRSHAIPRRYYAPILYLADRMANIKRTVGLPNHESAEEGVENLEAMQSTEEAKNLEPSESAEGTESVEKKRMVNELAGATGMSNFRQGPEFRTWTDQKACALIDLSSAKTATLVVLTLVLKANEERTEEEMEFFRKIRELLEAEPVSVPADLEAHKKLALDYLGV